MSPIRDKTTSFAIDQGQDFGLLLDVFFARGWTGRWPVAMDRPSHGRPLARRFDCARGAASIRVVSIQVARAGCVYLFLFAA